MQENPACPEPLDEGQSYSLIAADSFLHRARLYAECETEVRTLEQRQEYLKNLMAQLEKDIVLDMAEHGSQNINIGGYTIYKQTQRFVRKKANKDGVTTADICEALIDIGRGDMVSAGYNANTLKALICEMKENGEDVPERLGQLLEIGEKEVIRATRSR